MEYLLILNTDGNIKYSKCFGGFCEALPDERKQQLEKMIEGVAKAPMIFSAPDNSVVKYQLNRFTLRMMRVGKDHVLVLGTTKERVDRLCEMAMTSVKTYIESLGIGNLGDPSVEKKFTEKILKLAKHTPHFETEPCGNKTCPFNSPPSRNLYDWTDLREKHNLKMERAT